MLIKSIDKVSSFLAGDLTTIKEILHPKNDPVDLSYSLAHATLAVGTASIPHILHGSEVYIIMEGRGKMVIEEEEAEVGVGDIIHVPPKANQHIVNIGPDVLKFLCIVAPAWSEEQEEVL